MKRKKNLNKNNLIIFIFGIAILWFIFKFTSGLYFHAFIKTSFAEESIIEEKIETKAAILKEESLIYPPFLGKLESKYPEFERIEKFGFLFNYIAEDSSQKNAVFSPVSGIVSYEIDGYEEEENYSNILNEKKKDEEASDKPICKVINNLSNIFLYIELEEKSLPKNLEEGKYLKFRFSNFTNDFYYGKIVEFKKAKKLDSLLLELSPLELEILVKRIEDIDIVFDSTRGTKIPRKALVFDEERGMGVFYVNKGFVSWKAIEIVRENDEYILIKGLDPLTEIVLTPKLVKEKQYIY